MAALLDELKKVKRGGEALAWIQGGGWLVFAGVGGGGGRGLTGRLKYAVAGAVGRILTWLFRV